MKKDKRRKYKPPSGTIWTCHTCGKQDKWVEGWSHFGPCIWCSEKCADSGHVDYQAKNPDKVLYPG